MQWQDIVISVAQIGFVFALIPSIKSSDKPSITTSAMYASLVTIITICFLTLHLWFSALTAAMGAISWMILVVQKYQIDKRNSSPETEAAES